MFFVCVCVFCTNPPPKIGNRIFLFVYYATSGVVLVAWVFVLIMQARRSMPFTKWFDKPETEAQSTERERGRERERGGESKGERSI